MTSNETFRFAQVDKLPGQIFNNSGFNCWKILTIRNTCDIV